MIGVNPSAAQPNCTGGRVGHFAGIGGRRRGYDDGGGALVVRQRVFGFGGYSGSGKTTLVVRLIEHFTAAGVRVGAVKHTHHPLPGESRGDSERFRAAGAVEVVLAAADGLRHWRRGEAAETRAPVAAGALPSLISTPLVLIEGLKHERSWPRFALLSSPGEEWFLGDRGVVALVTDQAYATTLPLFRRDAIDAIAAFIGRISGS
jgi:molybdopterin-guanine dinucleotide biosynthesis adapter protein